MNWLQLSLDEGTDPERFAAELHHQKGPLAASWTRSLAHGFHPDHHTTPCILTAQQLRHHRARAGTMLSVLGDKLAPSLHDMTRRGYSVVLADQAGVVVDRREGRDFDGVAERVTLMPGANWDEATRGTNAIGTAIAERRPVMVSGPAHLDRNNRQLVCYAAPIRDPWGDLLGVLDATSYVGKADPYVGTAIQSVAGAIEQALQLRQLAAKGPSLAIRLIGRLHEPAWIVSSNGRITHANHSAIATGMMASSPIEVGQGVGQFQAPLASVLPIDIFEVKAAASGQIRLPGFDVEDIAGADGRCLAYLVIATAPRKRHHFTTPNDAFAPLFCEDASLSTVIRRAGQLAHSNLPLLLTGETGTGKEMFAKAIHAASARRDAPFISINCGAIAPSVIHAELFGYAPHSFTGADSKGRDGYLAAANGGTLFLDEVAEMPLPLQALFLRFLEDGQYHRVGETQRRESDVRIVAATCQDLACRMKDGRFRADLFYRLCGTELHLPALRDRADTAQLAHHLLTRLATDLRLSQVPVLSEAAVHAVVSAPWPGNVRQLRSALHHALVVSDDSATIQHWHLPPVPQATDAVTLAPQAVPLEDANIGALKRALNACSGNVSAAARTLGVARSTVYRMARRYGIDLERQTTS